jgi:outer membrane protein OmpA-like peptidoglycan-associated protein
VIKTMLCSTRAAVAGVTFLLVSGPTVMAQVTPRSARTSDVVILRDLARLDSLEQVALTRATSDAPNRLQYARSAAYISLAREAYVLNDDGTLTNRLLQAASSGRSALTQAPSNRELWTMVSDPRRTANADSSSVAQLVALETALVRSEQSLLGAPSCKTWGETAQRMAAALQEPAPAAVAVVAVETPAPTPAPIAVAPVVVPPSAPIVAPRELRGVPSRVHFGLDRSDLSTGSRRVLDALVDSLQAFPQIRIVLFGHTDMRASAAYNAALSQRRAVSVQRYLIGRGIMSERMTYEAKGKSELEMGGESTTEHARNRRVEMRFIAPDGRDIPSTQQLDDLQLEGAVPVRAVPRVRPGVGAKPVVPVRRP